MSERKKLNEQSLRKRNEPNTEQHLNKMFIYFEINFHLWQLKCLSALLF